MSKRHHLAARIAAAAVLTVAGSGVVVAQPQPVERPPIERMQAETRQNVPVGTLTCDLSPGVGLIVGSQRSMTCSFRPERGTVEYYTGTVSRFGLDVGVTAGATMAWAVFAPSRPRTRGVLAGSYSGVSGEATVGVGLGANVLVGGSSESIALQPLSVQAQAGLNLALGVAAFTLTPGRTPDRS